MRQSQHFGITLKEAPREAPTAAHRLLLRAGYLRSVSAGIPVTMPYLLRVLSRLGRMLQAELDARQFEELSLPLLRPAANRETLDPAGMESTEEPGFAFRDRRGATLGIGGGLAGMMAAVAGREIRSYKDLPRRVFQIARQIRDTAGPRTALINDHEFLALDAFGFDADEAGIARAYQSLQASFDAVCRQAELPGRWVEDDLATEDAGTRHALAVPLETSDETVVLCQACAYAASRRAGRSRLEVFPQDREMRPMQAIHGPGLIGVGPLAEFLGIPVWKTTKTLLFQADDRVVAVMVRGDCDVNEAKVKHHLKCRTLALASPQTIRELTGAEVGYAGGVGLPPGLLALADHFTRERVNFECGANRTDYHNINVNWGRDLPLPAFGDFKMARAGERCPRCEIGSILETPALALGSVAKLPIAAEGRCALACQGRDGRSQPVAMLAGRLDLSRVVAAVVERHHDPAGLRWPPCLAPFDIHLVGLNLEDEGVRSAAESIYHRLRAEGFEVLLDDRDARAGEKFSDSDLIGIPVRLTVSKRTLAEGRLELKLRGAAQGGMVSVDEALLALRRRSQGPMDPPRYGHPLRKY
jgi:prolyl-tRNA synthetase